LAFEAQATHNRAGEITYEILDTPDGLTIRATITTYTKASSIAADRDTLDICWVGVLARNKFMVWIPNCIAS